MAIGDELYGISNLHTELVISNGILEILQQFLEFPYPFTLNVIYMKQLLPKIFRLVILFIFNYF
jgi:hypothetical protein